MKVYYKRHPLLVMLISVVLSIVLGIIVLSVFVLHKGKKNQTHTYATYTVESQADSLFKGSVVASTFADYTKDVSLGELSKVNVIEGQEIKAGDVLLTYTKSSNELSSHEFTVKSAENELVNAKADMTEVENKDVSLRTKFTKAKNDAEKQVLNDQIETNNEALKTAQRALTTASLALEQAQTIMANQVAQQTISVTSKTAGNVVMGIDSETGPLLSVVSKETFVLGKVSEYDYDKLKVNDNVKVETVDFKKKVSGKISFISSVPEKTTGDLTSTQYNFKVNLDEPLQNGYTVQIHLPNASLYIPKSTVKSGHVYIKKGEQFKEVKVDTKEVDGKLQVVSGLKVGDKLIKEASTYVDHS